MTGFPNSADTLITNAHLLTMDDAFTEFPQGAVAITDGKITSIGPALASTKVRAGKTIDAGGGLVAPGFVNTHCHAAMTLFRGIADDRPLDGFLKEVWAAEAAHVRPETVEAGAALGFAEMALGGVTHVVDMYFHPEATIAAAARIGVGLTTGPVFIGFDGIDHLPWPNRLRFAERIVDEYHGREGVDLMLMPHSAYTLDAKKLREIADMSARFAVPVHVHAAEAPSEMRLVADQHGSTPIRVLNDCGLLNPGTLIAHGVHLDDEEIALLCDRGAAVSHCPLSNAKLASGTARIKALRNGGVVLSLGTDGASSGNDLDMWKTMRQAAYLQILATGEPDVLPARELFAMATRGGAASLGKGDRTGMLAPGYDADIMIIDTTAPHMVPVYDPYSALVYSAGREDVTHVLARGRHIVADRKLATSVEADVSVVQEVAGKIRSGSEDRA